MADLVYPYAPGSKGTDTAIAAAEGIRDCTARLQRAALFAIGETGTRGLTAEELAARLGVERVAIQPRTSELRRLGLIVDSGQRRRNASGRSAIVWAAKGGVAHA